MSKEVDIGGGYIGLLLDRAARMPQRPWLHQPSAGRWITYTWAQGLAQVQLMASALRATGLAPGSRIAISGRNTAHWFLADLAIAMAGYVSVGLYPRQSVRTTRYILEHADIRAVFVGPAADVAELVQAIPAGVSRWSLPYPEVPALDASWDELIAGQPRFTGYVRPSPERMLNLIYTSGTSGQPKGVMITQGNTEFLCAHFLEHVIRPLGFALGDGSERLLSYLPLAHLFERMACLGASLLLGAQVYFLENIEAMGETLRRVSPTLFVGVPLVYARLQAGVLAALPQARLDRLLGLPLVGRWLRRAIRRKLGLARARLSISASAPIAPALLAWFERLGVEIMEGYGQTENFAYATLNLPWAKRLGSVGKALPDAEITLAADDEVLIRHGGVMAGYYRDEERTRESVTADGFLRSGDRGRFDADGYLYIVGRSKDIFKTMKGRYVAPAPIEEAFRTGDVESCCLVGPGISQPILLVSLGEAARRRPREQVQAALLASMERVNAGLESHERIAKCVVVAEPWTVGGELLTPTMKVKRDQVQQHYAELIARESSRRTPFAWEAEAGTVELFQMHDTVKSGVVPAKAGTQRLG